MDRVYVFEDVWDFEVEPGGWYAAKPCPTAQMDRVNHIAADLSGALGKDKCLCSPEQLFTCDGNRERYATLGEDAPFYWLVVCGRLIRNPMGVKKGLDYEPLDRKVYILRNVTGQARRINGMQFRRKF